MSLISFTGVPGMGTAVESTENSFLWGPNTWYLLKGIVVSSAAVDAGSSPTTDLRPGLVLGKVTSSGEYVAYSATATDGSEVAEGVLFQGIRTIDPLSGSASDRLAQMVVGGPVKGGSLYGIDQLARAQMHGRFIFDDDLVGNRFGWRQVVAKTSAYTVTAADRDTIFTNQGASAAVAFTLPTIAKGLKYLFYSEDNDGLSIVAATGDTLVCHNDAAADSIALSTTGRNIGGAMMVVANADATKWLVIPFIWNIADDGSTTTKFAITT